MNPRSIRGAAMMHKIKQGIAPAIANIRRSDERSYKLGSVGVLNDVFTFETWFKPTATGATFAGDILTQRTGANAACGLIYLSRDTGTVDFGFAVYPGANTFALTSANYADDEWYHLVFTYNSTSAIVYVNGVAVITQAVTGNNVTAEPIYLGGNNAGGNYFANGSMGDYRVVNNVALTSGQVQARYDQLKGKYLTNLLPSLASWSAFSGATLTESNGEYTLTDGNAFSGAKYTIPTANNPLNGQPMTYTVTAKAGTATQVTLRIVEEGDSDGDSSNFETIASQTYVLTSEYQTFTLNYVHNFNTEFRAEIKAGTHAGANEGTVIIQDNPSLV